MYTDKQIDRCAQMTGSFGKELDRLFQASGIGKSATHHLASASISKKHKADIAKFVREYKKDKLLAFIPGRIHKGFENFTYRQSIKDPQKMGRTMRSLAEQMDDWRSLSIG